MIDIKPKLVVDENSKKVGVIITVRNFERIMEDLEDLHDYRLVKERSGKKERTFTPEEIRAELIGRK